MTEQKSRRGGARKGAGRPRKEGSIAKQARRAIEGTGIAVLGWHDGEVVTMAQTGSASMTPTLMIEKALSRMGPMDDERAKELREQIAGSLLANLDSLGEIAKFMSVGLKVLMENEAFRDEWRARHADSTSELVCSTQKSKADELGDLTPIR